jgi:AcrR family transcriptional regulator
MSRSRSAGTLTKAESRSGGGLDQARRAEIGEARRMRSRAALIDAAITVLGHAEGRFATVDDVLRKSAISRGTFYNHFDGREQFLEAVAYKLSHDFNDAIDATIAAHPDPALRAAIWTRHYLRRVRSDPHWGWAVVNVGLNGTHLLGEETYRAARANNAEGYRVGTFNVANADVALDLSMGIVFSSALTILRGPTKPDHPEATACVLLIGLGVPAERAKEIVAMPLKTVPSPKQ